MEEIELMLDLHVETKTVYIHVYKDNMRTNNYNSFWEFYPFYLSQHQNSICRLLHFIGTSLIILLFVFYVNTPADLILIPLVGYGFAWAGHFFFEKNRPATFTYPLYSFIGDWLMFKDILFKKESIINPKLPIK